MEEFILKPIIGLTVFYDKQGERTFSSISNNYINAVKLAGGIPILIPIEKEALNDYVDMVDGFLFTGGADVNPILYGEAPIPKLGLISEERDSFEIKLFNKAYLTGKPILGICRGLQLINVALGGTLYQDIYSQIDDISIHNPNKLRDELQHSVVIQKDSSLYKILEHEEVETNSFHHQAVKTLGRNLRVTAKAKDNIIEAYDSMENPNLICVQWHPEDLVLKYPHFLQIFRQLCIKS